eukprot:6188888-Pleurochrysis_carterae.AAC.1
MVRRLAELLNSSSTLLSSNSDCQKGKLGNSMCSRTCLRALTRDTRDIAAIHRRRRLQSAKHTKASLHHDASNSIHI